jgi:outer membrane receptor for ferrienterochelin and colicins
MGTRQVKTPALGACAALVLLTTALPEPAYAEPVPIADIDDLPPLPGTSGEPNEDAEDYEGAEGKVAVVSASAAREEVVTGAAKREQSLGNVASAVTVVTGDRLRRMGYRTVAEALRAVAGLYVVDDRMTPRLGVRGLQLLGDFNTRLLVLIDGATVNEPWNQMVGISWDTPVPIDDVARIEVIRGPVSSVYGTNAFFCIINIVTRGAGEAPRVWGRVSGSDIAAGSAAAGFAVGDVDHQLRGSVAALYRDGEQLSIPMLGDEIDADGERAMNASLVGAYAGAFAQVRFYRKIRELAGSPFDTEVGNPKNRNYDTELLVEGGYTRELGRRLTLTGRAYVNRYWFEDFLVYDPDPFRDFGDSSWYGGELRGRWAILRGERGDLLGLTGGGELTFIDTKSRSFYQGMEADGTIVPLKMNLQGLYAEFDAGPLPWLSLTGGVRLDRNSVLENRISPRAAVFLGPTDRYGLKLLYAEGFRNPSALEGFFDDGTDFIGNPDLEAETIRSYEAVFWGRPLSGLSTRLSAFLWRADQLVEQEEVDVGGGETRLQFQNLGGLTVRGLEAELSFRDRAGWSAFAGACLAAVEDPKTHRDARNSPLATASGGVSSPLIGEIGHLSTELVYVGERKTRQPMQAASAFLGWNATIYVPNLSGFDLTIGVRNLLGRREEVPVQEDYDRTDPEEVPVPAIPGEGREFYARLGYSY